VSRKAEDTVRRLSEAAAWRVYLSEIDANSTVAFEDWLAADSGNRSAWESVDGAMGLIEANTALPEVVALRRRALYDVGRFGRSRRVVFATGTAVALITAIVGIGAFWLNRPDDYVTQLGERRTITLSDNSKVTLDSGSELRVSYSRQERNLDLVHGQARFAVAHDIQRPFAVHAAGHTVVATGTDFDVDIPGPDVRVTLIQGHVKVVAESGEVGLSAGEQLIAAPNVPPRLLHVDVNDITSWERGRLIFDNEPLSSVVARVSRYSTVPIGVADSRAASIAISGVFNTGDVEGFVETITRYLPVTASRGENGEIWLRSKA